MTFPLPDQVTYWLPTLVNGKVTFPGVGILANARVASKQEEVVTEQGKEPLISRLAVYFDSDVNDINVDYLFVEGDLSGQPRSATKDARRVLALSRVNSGTTIRRLLV